MYVTKVPNRNSPPAILLRESYRENGKVKNKTLANLSSWPEEKVSALQRVLKGETLVSIEDTFDIVRSLPFGHVTAVRGTLRRLGLHKVLGARRSRHRDIIEAMIVARILDPASKLATTRELHDASATSVLGEELELGDVGVHELYNAMDWLLTRQKAIEKTLAARHLEEGSVALYDLSATHFEGRTSPLGKRGYPRGSKKGKLQVNFGLLCDVEGRPISVSVYPGNTSDPATVGDQVQKLRKDFGLRSVVMVGDRGMLTAARIREDLAPNEGMQWVTSLRAPQIRKLAEGDAFQLSFFDEHDLAEFTHPTFPGERLVICKNPLLEAERKRKRDAMLVDTEKKLAKVQAATQREKRALKGKDKIGIKVGRVLERSKMGKHFTLKIEQGSFTFERDEESIEREARLDGLYILRTNVSAEVMDSEKVVSTYKQLHHVERAFRCTKTVDLHIRPIHHCKEERVRTHIFLCMLAYYVEWHMRRSLAPLLFDDHDKERAAARRTTIVSPAVRSEEALAKAASKRTEEDLPVHSFQTLLAHLATLTRNKVVSKATGLEFERLTRPTPTQAKALELLEVSL
jgi:transposase